MLRDDDISFGSLAPPKRRKRLQRSALFCRPDKLLVPGERSLGYSALGRVIHVDQTKPWAVAVGPFKVIQQRPDEIAADVSSGLPGIRNRGEMFLYVFRSFPVIDRPVRLHRVDESGSILADINRRELGIPIFDCYQGVG